MTEKKIENLVGALALALCDEVERATTIEAPEAGPAAAALVLIGQVPGMTIEWLRRSLGLSHPGAVRLVDRLTDDRLVERLASTTDRRAVALQLTSSGTERRLAILSARRSGLYRALAKLSRAERATLGVLVEKLLRGIVRDEDHACAICRLCDDGSCGGCPVDQELAERRHPID